MKNTFRCSLTRQDYISFEKTKQKMYFIKPLLIFGAVGMVFIAYAAITSKNYTLLIAMAISLVLAFVFCAYSYNVTVKKTVDNYLKGDSSYLKPIEFTVDENTVEIKNLPEENEAGTVGIYPYSIMNAIYENEKYFYFIVGMEAKILPKVAVPEAMKAAVFSAIKNNPNCVFVK